MRQFKSQAIPPDHALIEVAMIEVPLGDAYVNQKIWEHTCELIDPGKRGILDDNGFRVGQLVGAPPLPLQKLLLSPKSCTNTRGRSFPAGKAAPIVFSAIEAQMSYEIVHGGQRTEIVLEQARFGFDVTARFTVEGTVLSFTPRVEHGAPALPFEAVPERSTWELRVEKSARKHAELTWEALLGANQYLIIGGRMDRERTLGQVAFAPADNGNEMQRLLVIRNCRATAPVQAESTVTEDAPADRTMPLALQAALPAPRGKAK